MAEHPTILRSRQALQAQLRIMRQSGGRVALVPTMGALHSGHMALIEAARHALHEQHTASSEAADNNGHTDGTSSVIVSIFVNPTQFAPNEDLDRYPRDEAGDVARLAQHEVEYVYMPSLEDMYPSDFATKIEVSGPAVAGLEDRFRPHHFSGVATVVAKLLIQSAPDIAIFGEKDYQQLKVVARMAADLSIPVEIIGVPTVREADGLALSSRNAYLSEREREIAPLLYRVLREITVQGTATGAWDDALAAGVARLTGAGFKLDYLEARQAESLANLSGRGTESVRVLVAAWLGNTRLIDNVGA